MPYYKDAAGKLHFLDNASFVNLLPAGCVQITDSEANAIQNPPKPLAEVKAEKLASLAASRDAATVAPVTVSGKTISADPAIQTGIKRLGDRMRRGKPTSLQAILDTSGNPVSPVTQTLLDAYEDAVAANTETAWNHYGLLVAQVNAATDAATVNAIIW